MYSNTDNQTILKVQKLLILILLTILVTSCEKLDFDFSQTNSEIIFISRRIENSASWNLIKMNSDGSQQEKLTELTARCEKPVHSHSGESLLFVHYSEDHFYELYLINLNGTNLTLLDRATRYCGSSDWSFDDSKIIYSRNRNESTDDKDLILLDLLTGKKDTLTETGNNFGAKFSFNDQIAYCQENNSACSIWTMKSDGSNKQIIIDSGSYPIWSPDGERIAYISKGKIGSPQIFVSDNKGNNSKQLTESYLPCWDSGFPPFGNYDPHWTPDGEKIVYQSDVHDGTPEIYIMNNDGSRQNRLTDTERRNDSPTVTPDSKFILLSSNRDTNFGAEIYVMDINGTDQYSLSNYIGDDCFPVAIKPDN